MSSIAQRASILAVAAASLTLSGAPASAQADRTAVLNILVECAKIDDPTARLACYDNNMTRAGATARATVPGQTVRGVAGGAAPIEIQGPQGFGYEDVRAADPARFQPRPGQAQEIHPRVASITPREPGIYLVTLDDGAQWLFAEGVSSQFRLPGRGDQIEIERGSLGSFLMRVDGQPPVPVRRIR
jgi:hypothetical protein